MRTLDGHQLRLPDGRRVAVCGTVTIGSGPEADACVAHPTVRPEHATLRRVGDRWLLEARDGLVCVGDAGPGRLHWVRPGDRITLGDGGPSLAFEAGPTPASAAVMPPAAPLVEVPEASGGTAPAPSDRHPTPVAGFREAASAASWGTSPLSAVAAGVAATAVGSAIALVVLRSAMPTAAPAAVPTLPAATAVEPDAPEPPDRLPPPSVAGDLGADAPGPGVPAPAAAEPAMTADELLDRYGGRVAFVRVEARGFLFPHASGWLAAPDQVLTTAAVARSLGAAPPGGLRLAVRVGEQVVPVLEVRVHADYDAADPASDASRVANAGLLILERPVPIATEAPQQDRHLSTRLRAGAPFHVLYAHAAVPLKEPFDPLRDRLRTTTLRLERAAQMVGRPAVLLSLGGEAPARSAEGGIVFSAAGRAAGLLAAAGGETTVVPWSVAQDLLEPPRR